MNFLKTLKYRILIFVLILCIGLSAAISGSAADLLSRRELAVMVAEALDLQILAYEGMFTDVHRGSFGAQQVEAVCRAGFMYGEGGLFNPQGNVDRISLASVGVEIFEKEIGKTQIPVFGAYYDDYVLLNKEMAYVLDVTAMMNIMEGVSHTYFGCFEPADTQMADEVLGRVNHLILRKRKLELAERIAIAASEDASFVQKVALICEAREMEKIESGGIVEFNTPSLGFDFDNIVDFLGIKADDTLNVAGNAIAVRFDSDSVLGGQITEVLVGDIPVDYVILPGRIIFSHECFPVSGMYTVCIKSSELPDICFEQMIHDKTVTFGAK